MWVNISTIAAKSMTVAAKFPTVISRNDVR